MYILLQPKFIKLKINVDGKLTNNPILVSKSFNTHFLTTADNVKEKTQNITNSVTNKDYSIKYLIDIYKNPFPNIKYSNTTTYELNKIIKSLKSTNAHGYDEIPLKILKIVSDCIISPLTYIYNKSLSAGVFPDIKILGS
jgi:hypothetical protein